MACNNVSRYLPTLLNLVLRFSSLIVGGQIVPEYKEKISLEFYRCHDLLSMSDKPLSKQKENF